MSDTPGIYQGVCSAFKLQTLTDAMIGMFGPVEVVQAVVQFLDEMENDEAAADQRTTS